MPQKYAGIQWVEEIQAQWTGIQKEAILTQHGKSVRPDQKLKSFNNNITSLDGQIIQLN